jgi:hypothetical protein
MNITKMSEVLAGVGQLLGVPRSGSGQMGVLGTCSATMMGGFIILMLEMSVDEPLA